MHHSAELKIDPTVLKLVETYFEHHMKLFFALTEQNKQVHGSHGKTELQINYENQWDVRAHA